MTPTKTRKAVTPPTSTKVEAKAPVVEKKFTPQFTNRKQEYKASVYRLVSKSKKRKNIYYYKMGYKDVPKKIKGSGLEVKKLYEGEFNEFQKGRIDIFEKIENELNDLPPLISNAKNKTVEYYSSNPGSYAIINSTDLILEYIKDIKTLLKGK